jgi:hypothetical protein
VSAGIGLCVLLLIPHADGHRYRTAWDDEHNFVLEARLLAQHGNDVLLNGLSTLRDTVRL